MVWASVAGIAQQTAEVKLVHSALQMDAVRNICFALQMGEVKLVHVAQRRDAVTSICFAHKRGAAKIY